LPSKNNNNSNKQNHIVEEINKITPFTQRWEIEEKEWNTLPKVDFKVRNSESGQTKVVKRPTWPRIPKVEERVYKTFFSRICDPETGTFYPERDLTGNAIEPSDSGPRARYIIHNIVRIRTHSGQEFLYSSGTLCGFSSLGSPIYHPIHKPEMYLRTHWHKERDFNRKTGKIEEIVKSPSHQQEIYTLPFSSSTVEDLFQQHTIKPNTPAVYIRNNKFTIDKPCNFVVKDQRSNTSISVEWGDIHRTKELFATKSFAYLFNAEYIPEPLKAEMRSRSEAISGAEKSQSTIPKIEDNNATNTTSTKNTDVYK
jgi:hypothetical protein